MDRREFLKNSAVLSAAVAFLLSKKFFGSFKLAFAVVIGLAVGTAIGKITEYYTSDRFTSVRSIAHDSETGDATTIISGLAVGQAQALANQTACCCETKQMIMQSNYDGAMRDAATNANFTAQIQSVKDMIAQDKIESLQAQVNKLELAQATAGVVRYPMTTSYSVPSPCFGGCGCNC